MPETAASQERSANPIPGPPSAVDAGNRLLSRNLRNWERPVFGAVASSALSLVVVNDVLADEKSVLSGDMFSSDSEICGADFHLLAASGEPASTESVTSSAGANSELRYNDSERDLTGTAEPGPADDSETENKKINGDIELALSITITGLTVNVRARFLTSAHRKEPSSTPCMPMGLQRLYR